MGKLKHKLHWDKPQIINPTHPALPWINLCIIILTTIPSLIIGFGLIIASSSIQGTLVIGEQQHLWFTIIFFLLIAIIIPIANWYAERFGDKTMFFIGATLFFTATFCSAFTTHYGTMMCLRTVAAVGAGSIFLTTLTIINRMFTPKQKSVAVAIYVACAFGIGTTLGTFIGGFAAEFLSWPAIFLIAASSAPLTLLCTWLFIPERERTYRPHFDILGVFFYLLSIGTFVTGIANVKQPWTTEGVRSPWMITCGILFILSFCGFIWRDLAASEPLINIRLFKFRPFLLGNLSIFVVATTLFSTITQLSAIFEKQLYYSKYHIGLLHIPFGICIGVCGSISGLLTQYIGIRIPAMIGISLVSISCFTQHSITIQSEYRSYLLLQALRGIGIGCSMGPFTALALKNMDTKNIGHAAIIVTLFRQLGGSLGSIIIGLIQSIRFPFHLLRFGEQMNLTSPALEDHLIKTHAFLVNQAGSMPTVASYSAQGLNIAASVRELKELRTYATAQAQILSINDAYYIIGWVSAIVFIIVLFCMLRAKWKERKPN